MTKQTEKTSAETSAGNGMEVEKKSQFPLTRINFILMAVAAAMIVIGFCLTAGGGSSDPNVFNEDIFSARHIIIGPNLAFLGFIFMGVGIMWPSRKAKK